MLIEPGGCPPNYTDEQIKTLAALPVLVVFGDHRDMATGIGIRPSWQLSSRAVRRSSAASKRPAARRRCSARTKCGIRGNSHMIMQDKNNLQIADLILQWIDDARQQASRSRTMTRVERCTGVPSCWR